MPNYDIIINGGGIVGFTFLNLIFKSPYLKKCKVLLIEQASKPNNLRQQPLIVGGPNSSEWKEPNLGQTSEKQFSNRVSSITGASRSVLSNLEVWNDLNQYSKDVREIKVWNYDYSHRITFEQGAGSKDNGDVKRRRDVMFSVVENNRLSLCLLNSINKHNESSIIWNHSLQRLSHSHDNGLIEVVATNSLTGEEVCLNAPLILGCDGFKSKVRDYAGFKYKEHDLNKTAVVGTVRMESVGSGDLNDVAYQKFSAEKDTVAALLPLDNEYSSFVISAPKEYSKYLLDCDDVSFGEELNQLLASRETPSNTVLKGVHDFTNIISDNLVSSLFNIVPSLRMKSDFSDNSFEEPPKILSVVEGSRATFPLFFGTTTPRMVAALPGNNQSQIALLGDSAHRVHPLAGQGLNLGIQDAAELVRQLETVAQSGERVFSNSDHYSLDKALKRYELKRQAYIVPMTAGILSMPTLFKLLPPTIISSVNKCEPIKNTSIKFANGC